MNKKNFWITNISNMDVSLADLNLTIRAYSSINLLDNKHYHYTLEQLENSKSSGSLFKKRNKVYVRKVPPMFSKINLPVVEDAFIPTRKKSLYEIKQEKYEELLVSDDEFAEENADLADLDRKKAGV